MPKLMSQTQIVLCLFVFKLQAEMTRVSIHKSKCDTQQAEGESCVVLVCSTHTGRLVAKQRITAKYFSLFPFVKNALSLARFLLIVIIKKQHRILVFLCQLCCSGCVYVPHHTGTCMSAVIHTDDFVCTHSNTADFMTLHAVCAAVPRAFLGCVFQQS